MAPPGKLSPDKSIFDNFQFHSTAARMDLTSDTKSEPMGLWVPSGATLSRGGGGCKVQTLHNFLPWLRAKGEIINPLGILVPILQPLGGASAVFRRWVVTAVPQKDISWRATAQIHITPHNPLGANRRHGEAGRARNLCTSRAGANHP